MTARSDHPQASIEAARELERLQEQVRLARTELDALQRDLGHAIRQDDLSNDSLREANEKLVIALLRNPPERYAGAGDDSTVIGDVTAMAVGEDRYEQLQTANEQLLQSALNAQLLQSTAEQMQQRQTDSMAVLVHELRGPLTPIRLAVSRLTEVRPEDLPRLQALIEQKIVHMSRLLSDLLDVSRVSTGKLRIERHRTDLAVLIEQAIEASRPAMDARLQRFDACLPVRTLDMWGDPVRLAQVLGNLLDNASKYTPNGGKIALSVVVADATVELTVSDDGVGIGADALPHIFEPFVQDARAVSFNGAGLGIGLTVVRELVEAHGGSVHAYSAGSGRGSRFVVSLPLADHANREGSGD